MNSEITIETAGLPRLRSKLEQVARGSRATVPEIVRRVQDRRKGYGYCTEAFTSRELAAVDAIDPKRLLERIRR